MRKRVTEVGWAMIAPRNGKTGRCQPPIFLLVWEGWSVGAPSSGELSASAPSLRLTAIYFENGLVYFVQLTESSLTPC